MNYSFLLILIEILLILMPNHLLYYFIMLLLAKKSLTSDLKASVADAKGLTFEVFIPFFNSLLTLLDLLWLNFVALVQ